MTDVLILPVAQQLLTCLCDALPLHMDAAKVPAQCCFRVGESVSADASAYEDVCCSGLAFVRFEGLYVADTEYPAPDTEALITGCGPNSWGLQLDMGVLRCAPTGSATQIPTCTEWTDLMTDIMNDARAMRAALCCFAAQQDPNSVSVSRMTPLPTSGGCAGLSWQISVQIINECEDC